MSKKLLLLFIALALPLVSAAGTPNSPKTNVVVSSYDDAQDVLAKIPFPSDLSAKTKQLYLSAQLEHKKGNIKEAIRLYRKVLDERPDFVRARFELALCYMDSNRWDRADYYLRLAMAAEDLPDDVKQVMEYYRYLVRQNKNWDFWFDYDGAPDTRATISNTKNCTEEEFGDDCEQLTESKDLLGIYFAAGADYEFKLSDNWRWKSDAEIHTNIYKENRYDDLYLSGSTGPRYIWDRGDIWLAGVVGRSWYERKKLGWSYGAKIDTNYELTRKLSSGLILLATNNVYDEYDYLMGGQTYSATPHFTYYIDSTKYFVLLGELERENTKIDFLSNYTYGSGLGFGMEMPYGFLVYLESYFYWVNYDGENVVEKDGELQLVKEKDFFQKYTLSLSNVKIEYFGFIPVFKVHYTYKDSNVPIPDYNKWSFGIGIKRKF